MDDLQQVKALEMQVDTRESSLGNFGKKTILSQIFPYCILSGLGNWKLYVNVKHYCA